MIHMIGEDHKDISYAIVSLVDPNVCTLIYFSQ